MLCEEFTSKYETLQKLNTSIETRSRISTNENYVLK
jgi:hypothetical protein